jgi:hypothetical protein
MATTRKKRASKSPRWLKQELAELKKLARQGLPWTKIAKTFRRTEGATRQKAVSEGIRRAAPKPNGRKARASA